MAQKFGYKNNKYFTPNSDIGFEVVQYQLCTAQYHENLIMRTIAS